MNARNLPLALFTLLLWTGCGAPARLEPLQNPQNAQPPASRNPAPLQRLLPPSPPEAKLEPAPQATRRVAVLVTERIGRAEGSRRDPELEPILEEELLSAGSELGLEVVKKGLYDDILARDFESLTRRGLAENGKVLEDLLLAGVDYLALAEIGPPDVERDSGRGRTAVESVRLHAGTQIVKTDDGTLLAVGNASSEANTAREAKAIALREASAQMVQTFRGRPQGTGFRIIAITIEGLARFESAEGLHRKLRETAGVIWTRDLHFSAGAPGAPGGTARIELAWNGSAEDLRSRIARLDPLIRLETTKVEGNRWNYHATEAEAQAASVPTPAPPPGSEK